MSERKMDLGKPVLMCDFNTQGSYNFNPGIKGAIARINPGMTIGEFCRKTRRSLLHQRGIAKKHADAIEWYLGRYGLRLGMSQKELDAYGQTPGTVQATAEDKPDAKKAIPWCDDPRERFLQCGGTIKLDEKADGSYTIAQVFPTFEGEKKKAASFLEVHNDKDEWLRILLGPSALGEIARGLNELFWLTDQKPVDEKQAALFGKAKFCLRLNKERDIWLLLGREGDGFVWEFRTSEDTQFALPMTDREIYHAGELIAHQGMVIDILNGGDPDKRDSIFLEVLNECRRRLGKSKI